MSYVRINGIPFTDEEIAGVIAEKFPDRYMGKETDRPKIEVCDDTERGVLCASFYGGEEAYHSLYVDLDVNKDVNPVATIEVPNKILQCHYGEKAPIDSTNVFLYAGMEDECSHIAMLYPRIIDGEGFEITNN